MVEIRETTVADHDAVIDVTLAAFRGNDVSGDDEVAIVRYVWDYGHAVDGLDLVAEVGGEMVGHVLGSRATVGGRPAVAVAPLSVVPQHQQTGVGSALMRALVSRADAAGHPLLALLGSPDYYPRFGFERGSSLGVTYGDNPPAFQVRRLSAYDESDRGAFVYCWGDNPLGPGR